MGRITVRAATPEDDPDIAEVDRLATADIRKVYRPTSAARKLRSSIEESLEGLVAMLDGGVVGTVRYRLVAGQLLFLGLGVHPDFRRLGVATALVQHLEKIGRESVCRSLALRTVRETGNVRIFERMGFAVESETPTDLFETQESVRPTEVVMRKDLGFDRPRSPARDVKRPTDSDRPARR